MSSSTSHHPNRGAITLALVAALAWSVVASCQEAPPEPDPLPFPQPEVAALGTNEPDAKLEGTVRSLDAFLKTITSKEETVAKLRQRFQAATDDVTRNQLLTRLEEASREAEQLNRQFEEFAVAVDISPFVEEKTEAFQWQEEVAALVRPIVAELKNATASTRIIGDLRAGIDEATEREQTAAAAVDNLQHLLDADLDTTLRQRLEADLEKWTQRREDAANRVTALQIQLDNRLAERKSVLDETTSYVKTFFRTRGLNLLLGITAFIVVFLLVRALGRAYDRLQASRRGRSFSNRLGTLLFQAFSVIGGLVATILVFNLVGDWFLLGIILIFLFGVAWASIHTLPAQMESIKLMLNIGAVREGERLVFDGSPWCVESLGFSAILVNPLLDGGFQRIPVRFLIDMHSRPLGADEVWFPTEQHDWVELSDGRIGQVAWQTPAAVALDELGSSRVIYRTADFLALSPRTLRRGFRVVMPFGIDYRHQAECTSSIPAAFQRKLDRELPEAIGADAVRALRIEFKEAAASSLDYEVELDLAGSAAERLPEIRRAVSRLLVEACNENHWEIPFQQVTVHQATAT